MLAAVIPQHATFLLTIARNITRPEGPFVYPRGFKSYEPRRNYDKCYTSFLCNKFLCKLKKQHLFVKSDVAR